MKIRARYPVVAQLVVLSAMLMTFLIVACVAQSTFSATTCESWPKGPEIGVAPPSTAKAALLSTLEAMPKPFPQIAGVAELNEDGDYSFVLLKVDEFGFLWGTGVGKAWPVLPDGACDSDDECEEEVDDMCEGAGHGGVTDGSVTITMHADGSKTCSGDCQQNGAVGFVICRATH